MSEPAKVCANPACTNTVGAWMFCSIRCRQRYNRLRSEKRALVERPSRVFRLKVIPFLPAGCVPVDAFPVQDFNLVPRRVLCRHYDQCLMTAIHRNWQGFSCMRCNMDNELSFRDVFDEQRRILTHMQEIEERGERW